MKTKIKQAFAIIAICGFVAACKFSGSEKQDVAQDTATTDTTAVVPQDTTQAEMQGDSIQGG